MCDSCIFFTARADIDGCLKWGRFCVFPVYAYDLPAIEIQSVLIAEAKLGKMLAALPKQGKTKQYGSKGGTIPHLPANMTKKESHFAQTIAANAGSNTK